MRMHSLHLSIHLHSQFAHHHAPDYSVLGEESHPQAVQLGVINPMLRDVVRLVAQLPQTAWHSVWRSS